MRTAIRGGWGAVAGLAGVGVLAAGCASASSAGPSHPGPSPTTTTATATATASASGTAATPTAVPTVTGGTAVSCIGFPTGTTSTSLPASFVPSSVERCVEGYQTVTGKGMWLTATLERADSGLTTLIDALRSPSSPGAQAGHACSAIATVPQVIVLIGASGQRLAYRLPSTGCDRASSPTAQALDALPWETVSVHLISPSPDLTGSASPGGTVTGLSTAS